MSSVTTTIKDLETLAARVNGFVYQGERLNALVATVEALRADPDLAARLLGLGNQKGVTGGATSQR